MNHIKQLITIAFLICITTISISAQEWGVVSNDEFSYQPPEEFKNNGVIVLFDKGLAKTEYRGLEYQRHVRYKVLDNNNLNSINAITISYYDYDSFKNLKAQIIKPDGTIINLDKDMFQTQKIGLKKETQFEFTSLSNGDIFEYSYQIDYYGGQEKLGAEKHFLFNLDVHNANYENRGTISDEYFRNLTNIPTWHFDHPVFCKTSEFIAQIGAELDYSFVSINLPKEIQEPVMTRVKVLAATAYKKYTWTVQDIAPFAPRDFQDEDYDEVNRVALYFKLFSTVGQNRMIGGIFTNEHFKHMGRNFQGYLKQYTKKNKTMKKAARKLVSKEKNPEENINAIKQYISKNFSLDSSGYTLRPVNDNSKKFFKKKVGAPFELNLLFVQFLQIAGFDAYPVLSITDNKVNFRFSGNFNHVIAFIKLDDKLLFADASYTNCPAGSLPQFTKATEGVLVDYDRSIPILINSELCENAEKVQKK